LHENLHHPDHDILSSDGDGSYDVSFFAASVAHSIDTSRRVFDVMSGGMLSQRKSQWSGLSDEDRFAYLLETHEMAHHGLFFSTTAGSLIWRLNQVISRDCGYLMSFCEKRNITFVGPGIPRENFKSPVWRLAFLEGANSPEEAIRRAYCLSVFEALEKTVRFKSILISKKPDTLVTVGEFVELANFVYAYLEDRCERPFVTAWKSKRSAAEPLFEHGHAYNLTDIAECQAISAELHTLRALDDLERFSQRVTAASNGPYRTAFDVGRTLAKTQDKFCFSPHYMSVNALTALCGAIDTVSPESSRERYIEDEFPWFRFRSWADGQGPLFRTSIENLFDWAQQPLIGQGANWLKFYDWEQVEGIDRVNQYLASVASLGLDMQIYSMHQGAMLNMRFLATVLADASPGSARPPGADLNPGDWMNQTRLAIHMIEYDDGLLFDGLDLDELYPTEHPIRQLAAFDLMQSPVFQLMAHIINGTSARNQFASFYWRQVPKLDIIRPKLDKHFGAGSMADELSDMLKNVYERGTNAILLVNRKRYV